MPNHITNMVKMVGSDERVREVLEFIKKDSTNDEIFPLGSVDFNKIIPMPEDIFKGNLGIDEKKKYGEKNWYDWSVSNWGTKWNAYYFDTSLVDENTIRFDTAWSTVPGVIAQLSSIFPDILFILDYADEDFGYNTGCMEFEDGDTIHENIMEGGSDEAMEHAEKVLGYNPYDEDEDDYVA